MKPISRTTVQVTGESLIATGIRNFGVVDETCKKRVTPEEFLAWINARTSGEEIRDRKSSPDFEIRIRDLGALVYLSATEDILYAAGSITDLVKHGISAPVLDTDAILMLLEAGFVLPPLTPLRGVYRVWPFSGLSLKGSSQSWELRVFSIQRVAKAPASLSYHRAVEALKDLLIDTTRHILNRCDSVPVVFTVSGGIDSSLLLILASQYVKRGGLVAATIKSPGQDAEFRRAATLGRFAGVQEHVVVEATTLSQEPVAKYAEVFGEPVYDEAVPGVSGLLQAVEASLQTNVFTVVEGQCADTVLLGLPHNQIMEMWSRLRPITTRLPLWLPRYFQARAFRNSVFARSIYRFKKAFRILGERNLSEAFMTSLGVTGAFRTVSERYYTFFMDVVSASLETQGSLQRGIAHFFMSRVLPVREMQKYRLPAREGKRFEFPYIAKDVFDFVDELPDRYLVTPRTRKRVLFDLSRELLPRETQTRSTAPLYMGFDCEANGMRKPSMELRGPASNVFDREVLARSVRNILIYCRTLDIGTDQVRSILDKCGITVTET